MLCFRSQLNLKISSPTELVSDTNMFCADAPGQIRIIAPNHTTRLNNCPTRPRADLNLAPVTFVSSSSLQSRSPGASLHHIVSAHFDCA